MRNIATTISAAACLTACHSAPAPTSKIAGTWPGCSEAITYSELDRGLSVLVVKDGSTICRSDGTSTTTPYELWSGTKSFVGVMAAAAIQDGLLSLDERASDTLGEWAGDSDKSDITLRQILSMTDGQPSQIGNPPTYQGAVTTPLNASPGQSFQYGPVPMQVFGEIMRRKLVAAGMDGDPQGYLDRRILRPLGIVDYRWRTGDDGNALMPQGAVLSAEDWMKFGQFILRGGAVDGLQIVDPDAFNALFKGSSANGAYGLTWWLAQPTDAADRITSSLDIRNNLGSLPSDLVYASGAGGQRLYIIPSRNMVIIRQAKLDIEAIRAGRSKKVWSDTHFLQLFLQDGARSPTKAQANTAVQN